jgi:hypothetical protein
MMFTKRAYSSLIFQVFSKFVVLGVLNGDQVLCVFVFATHDDPRGNRIETHSTRNRQQ